MNIRIDRDGVRLRLSADEARTLLAEHALIETQAVIRFGVRLLDSPPGLDGLIAHVSHADWEAAIARVGAKDAGIYATGLAVEIDAFTR